MSDTRYNGSLYAHFRHGDDSRWYWTINLRRPPNGHCNCVVQPHESHRGYKSKDLAMEAGRKAARELNINLTR